MCGTPVQAIWDHKNWSSWQGGSGKVKICPRMAWIWLCCRPEVPNWVNDSWNGPQMVHTPSPDWFKSISRTFEAWQPLYMKKSQIILTCEINDLTFWLQTSTDRTGPFTHDLIIFHTPPHVGCVWKIEKPWKKCIVWLVEVIKGIGIFYRILG